MLITVLVSIVCFCLGFFLCFIEFNHLNKWGKGFDDAWHKGFKVGTEVRSTLLYDIYDNLIKLLEEEKCEGYELEVYGLQRAKEIIEILKKGGEES